MAMFLLTKELKLTPTHVGRLLGGRDHSTVIHGANQVNSKIKDDTELLSGHALASGLGEMRRSVISNPTRLGWHSIRINEQWRIVFRWTGAAAEEVEIVDYHDWRD